MYGLRGGRIRASSIVGKPRSSHAKHGDIQLPSLLAMIPTVIAGTVG